MLVVVQENNYLGLYQHGDGDKVIPQENQEHHQLLPIQQDMLVQQDNYLGIMDGSAAVAVAVAILHQVQEVVLVLEMVLHQQPLGVDLQVLDLMDGVIGLLMALVVVEVVLEVHLLVEEKVVLVEYLFAIHKRRSHHLSA